MWGRGNIGAAILLLLAWTCIFVHGEERKPEVTNAAAGEFEARTILDRATSWLWSQRDKDAGWGNETHRVLLVLRMGNLSRDDDAAPLAPLELRLSAKQMELEIILLLWRHREVGFSAVRLARYTLALNAMCLDPRQFHGHDLIGTLQHHEPPTDYEFALTTLATCSARAHVRKRQIRRLLDIANAARDHNVDTVAMVILALRCIVRDHRHRNLQHFVREPSLTLARQQRADGSFGELRTSALAMQALEEAENDEPTVDKWNRSAALRWFGTKQRSDGSFDGSVRATAEALLAVTPRGLAAIRSLDCGRSVAVPDTSSPEGSTDGSTDVSSPRISTKAVTSDSRNETHSLAPPATTSGSNSTSTDAPLLVNVSYTLWVGSNVNETYNLTVTAPKNETFYSVMLLAAEMSPHFQFTASEWPNGHYVHTLAGYKEEPMSYHYWLLYRLPSPPDPSSPPGNQLVAPGGVDDLQISEGEHYLFWYKKL